MDVKPWEPVSGSYSRVVDWPWKDGESLMELWEDPDYRSCRVTLANGQRIIVRALSEDRKAARAFERRVTKAVEANR